MKDHSQEVPALATALGAWFRRGHRDLPWRHTRDPYAIWVSEVMLQQTRVETVAPRYTRWMARFPSARALAAARLEEVLEEWAGLGYYARARNLHAAAREIATRYGGRFPDQPEEVRALPGVGRYTAGAVLSIALGRPEPILDGNVIRVLSRLFRIVGDPRAAPGQVRLWALAGRFAAAEDPSVVNQALMELGATVCTPRAPDCLACPLRDPCAARQAGDPERFPSPVRAAPVRAVAQVSVALLRRGKVLLARRPPRGLWGGLLELPSGEPRPGEGLAEAARRVAHERVGLRIAPETPLAPFARFDHVLSHRRVTFEAVRVAAPSGRVRLDGYDAHEWVAPDARGLGVSRATSKLLDALGRSLPRRHPTPTPR